ncbi:MAG: nSTAND3 domain-containing NTPase [Candidatus Scalindua sp.]
MYSLIKECDNKINKIKILAETDIEELLDLHPKVVSAFPQILGLSQLKELTNWGLHQRSSQYLETAQKEIATFVATNPYLNAIDLLHKQHFCVLTGPPKMGKTCTAYAIAAAFSALGFEVYELRNQKDFFDAFTPTEKQVFICDDVFGDIALNAAQRDDWTRSFLRLLRSLGANHKLIWTAREYILKEAIESSRLNEERPEIIDTDTVTIAVDGLTRQEKAMILYNHAKAAHLPVKVIEFLKSDACVKIVDHACYSPESIRQLCTGKLVDFSGEIADGETEAIYHKVHQFLLKPDEAWKSAYKSSHPCEQLLCVELMAAGGTIKDSLLKARYENAVAAIDGRTLSFETALSNAVGTFLQIRQYSLGFSLIQFYHPSMRDLMVELFEQDIVLRRNYLKQLNLKEIPSIIKTEPYDTENSSSMHRIKINKEDISLVKDHLSEILLPNSSLKEVSDVLTEIASILKEDRILKEGRGLIDDISFPMVLWPVLDLVATHACSQDFWRHNMMSNELLYKWRQMFETFRLLLPLVSEPILPVYIPELLRRNENKELIDYWGLVSAAHSLAPTIVEQCVDLKDRTEFRLGLIEEVQNALTEEDEYDLENDFDDSTCWHDKYGSLADTCRDYEITFPDDDPIENWEDVSDIIENFPRIEYEPDQDDDYIRPSDSTNVISSDEIKGLFEDL